MGIRPASRLAVDINYDQLVPNNPADYYGKYSHQPEPWRPTAQGLGVTNSAPIASEFNANACLINRGAMVNETWNKIYLFVDGIKTGWTVSGEYAQAHDARTFYPRNLQQDQLMITGYVPSQDEYDKLVRFVNRHHYTALHGADYNNNWFHFVDFLLFRPFNSNSFDYFETTDSSQALAANDPAKRMAKRAGLNYGITILDMDAGHERFQFAPAFTLSCKVTDDRRDANRNAVAALYQTNAAKIDYVKIFGDYSAATPYTAGTSPESTAKTNFNQR